MGNFSHGTNRRLFGGPPFYIDIRYALWCAIPGDLDPWVVCPMLKEATSVNHDRDGRWIGKLRETRGVEAPKVPHTEHIDATLTVASTVDPLFLR